MMKPSFLYRANAFICRCGNSIVALDGILSVLMARFIYNEILRQLLRESGRELMNFQNRRQV